MNYDDVLKQLSNAGIDKQFLPNAELRGLPQVLQADERIKNIVRGLYDSRNGVLVSTNKRVFFFEKGLVWGSRFEEFLYENITSIQYKTGIMAAEIILYSAGKAAKIDMVAKQFCKGFVESVQSQMTAKRAPDTTGGEELLSKLERLAALKSAGALTEEEFSAAKEKLLGL